MAKPKNLIQASTAFERVVHWVLGGSCLFLFLTGLVLMFHPLVLHRQPSSRRSPSSPTCTRGDTRR